MNEFLWWLIGASMGMIGGIFFMALLYGSQDECEQCRIENAIGDEATKA